MPMVTSAHGQEVATASMTSKDAANQVLPCLENLLPLKESFILLTYPHPFPPLPFTPKATWTKPLPSPTPSLGRPGPPSR